MLHTLHVCHTLGAHVSHSLMLPPAECVLHTVHTCCKHCIHVTCTVCVPHTAHMLHTCYTLHTSCSCCTVLHTCVHAIVTRHAGYTVDAPLRRTPPHPEPGLATLLGKLARRRSVGSSLLALHLWTALPPKSHPVLSHLCPSFPNVPVLCHISLRPCSCGSSTVRAKCSDALM